jgi:creatinine amidohydrolase/Fe(II)-dependent formamide hydrolase-like protein
MQGTADGYVAVICHGGQEEAFSHSKEEEEVHLSGTAKERDGCVWDKQSTQHFGHNGEVESNLQEGQVSEKEVHGAVQHGVSQGKQNDEAVSHQGDQVDG